MGFTAARKTQIRHNQVRTSEALQQFAQSNVNYPPLNIFAFPKQMDHVSQVQQAKSVVQAYSKELETARRNQTRLLGHSLLWV